MNELGVQKEVRTQIMSPFWLRRVNYGSQYLRLVRLLLSNICIPDKNIGFVGNKRLSLFSMPGVRMKLCAVQSWLCLSSISL